MPFRRNGTLIKRVLRITCMYLLTFISGSSDTIIETKKTQTMMHSTNKYSCLTPQELDATKRGEGGFGSTGSK